MFPLQKKLLANTSFIKTKLRLSAVHAKYGETHISGNNLVPNVFGVVNMIQKAELWGVLFMRFCIGNEAFHKSNSCYYLLSDLKL